MSWNAHRGMPIPGGPPNNRLNELLDSIRHEFDSSAGRAIEYEQQVQQQMQEMELVRNKVYALERAQHEIKNKYEEELARLRQELERTGAHVPPSHLGGPPPTNSGPSQPQPPALGHGPSNLFGGIMAGGTAQGGPGLAPPPQDGQQPQGLPPHLQGAPGLNPAPTGPPQPPPFGYNPPPPGPNGYAPQGPPQAASPGPRGGRNAPPNSRLPGPPTPQQGSAAPSGYPNSPQVARHTPPPPFGHQQNQHMQQGNVPNVGNCLAELTPEDLPPQKKKEGSDWFAIFNPRVHRILDVDLVHNLPHASVVCCVRFSADGKYVATGCNRSAQIFDVETGNMVAHLQDQQLPEDGDLYIRSVCFSPDGRYLATGAEDKVIRVWDIANRTIKNEFRGHDQDIYSLDFARNGRLIASGSGDRTVRLWDVDRNEQILSMTIDDGVTTVAISPDNRLVAAGSLDKSVRVWDTTTGFLVERLEGEVGHKDSVYSVAFAPSGRELVSGSLDKTIKMWELNTERRTAQGGPRGGKCIRTFEGHKDFVLSVALTPEGNWVLSGSKDRGVQFWDPLTGSAQLMLQGHKNSVISVAPSPTGKLFATGSGDMRARIWSYTEYRGPQ